MFNSSLISLLMLTFLIFSFSCGQDRSRQFSIEDQLKNLKEKLELTEEQLSEIKPILEKQREEMKELRDSFEGERSEMRDAVREIRTETDKKINKLLTDEQKEKYQQMQEKRRQRRKRR